VNLAPSLDEIRSAAFISDLHLAAGDDRQLELLEQFLVSLRQYRVTALFVLGDLFDAWPGDDFLEDPFATSVAALLKAQSDGGVALFFMAGNRDFLIGEGFGNATGVQILSDPSAVVAAGRPMLLSHGDLLCTDDAAYQAFRDQVRSQDWRAQFLARPLAERQRIVASLRSESELAKAEKSAQLMDVNHDAVVSLMREHRHATLLHGHTHRPGKHQFEFDTELRERWVLPDWDFSSTPPRGGGVLALDGHLKLIGIDGAIV
jgi:UDP-2,3-diacylglucosamine hydrolase